MLALLLLALGAFALLQAEVVLVAVDLRQLAQRVAERLHQLVDGEDADFRRLRIEAGHRARLVGRVHHLHAARVGDHDFADEAVFFLHQHDVHRLVVADVQADLGAADTDGRHRRVEGHGVGVGLGDLAGHEREHALHDRKPDRAGLRRRVVDHFVEHDAAAVAHRERGFVGEQDADGAIAAGFENIALEHRVADMQLDPRAVRVHREHGAGQIFDVADRLAVGAADDARVLSHHGAVGTGGDRFAARRRAGKLRRHVAADLRAVGADQLRRVRLVEEAADREVRAVGAGHHQVGTMMLKICVGKIETVRQRNTTTVRSIDMVPGGGMTFRTDGRIGEFSHFINLIGRLNLLAPDMSRHALLFFFWRGPYGGMGEKSSATENRRQNGR